MDVKNKDSIITQEIINLKLKFGSLNFLRLALFYGAIFFFVTGAFIAIYQLFDDRNIYVRAILPWIVLLINLLVSFIIVKKTMPTDKQFITTLDSYNKCGGLLIAAYELNIGEWHHYLRLDKGIILRIELKKHISVFCLAVGFMFFSTFVPKLNIKAINTHQFEIGNDTKELKEQVEVLEEEEIITENQADELIKNIEEVEKNAIGENPQGTLEALEHIQKNLQNEAQLAEEKALSQLSELEMTAEIAKSLDNAQAKLDQVAMKNAMDGFNDMLNKLASENKELQKMLKKQQSAIGKKLTAKDLKSLQKNCNMSQEQVKKMLERLQKKNLLNKCNKPGSGKNGKQNKLSNSDLQKFLKKNCPKNGKGKGKKMLMSCVANRTGDKGISRGPGTAPMSWQRRFNSFKGNFQDESMPESNLSSLDDSVLLQESFTASEAGEYSQSKTGSLNSVKNKQTDDKSYTLQPKHRKAVSKFFNRKK